jgi:hypothetical protein
MERSVASQTSPHQPIGLRKTVSTSTGPYIDNNGTIATTDLFSTSRHYSNQHLDNEIKTTNIISYNDDADVITITCDTTLSNHPAYQSSPLPSPKPRSPSAVDQLTFGSLSLTDDGMTDDEPKATADLVCCPKAIAGAKCNLPSPLPPPPRVVSPHKKPFLPPHIRILPKTQSLDLADGGSGEFHQDDSNSTKGDGSKVPKLQSLDSRPIYPNVPYSPYGSPYGSPRSCRRRVASTRRVSIEQTGSFLQLNQYKLLDQIGQVRLESKIIIHSLNQNEIHTINRYF